MKDLSIESFTRPLVLVPDTSEQKIPRRDDKSFISPCPISEHGFKILEHGLFRFSIPAQFDFTGHPAYTIFNSSLFDRFMFWKPVLKKGYPIYIISPLFGLLWPGDRAGTYSLDMEEVFLSWRRMGLWEVVEEIFLFNECDGVLSYLPPLYNNVVRVDTIPWINKKPEQFNNDKRKIKKIALSTGE